MNAFTRKTPVASQNNPSLSPLPPHVSCSRPYLPPSASFPAAGLWEREFSEGGKDLRAFLGKKYTKEMMMHRAGLYRYHEDVQVGSGGAPMWGQGQHGAPRALPCGGSGEVGEAPDPRAADQSAARGQHHQHAQSEGSSDTWSVSQRVVASHSSAQSHAHTHTCSHPAPGEACHQTVLGWTEAWDQKGKGKLHLGGVLHWASLELTPQAGKGGSDVDENVEKPKLSFIFFVRDNTTGALLLMGALDQAEGDMMNCNTHKPLFFSLSLFRSVPDTLLLKD
ncbi:hypothetical protein KUCAC02_000521 [Chaenocephalus aceratus]|uniref:Uncharacterized protein n=1 Tax=Chaenocephalus aceratus TaxID=36190 RepID=A0ACB9W7M1_CHAAC|nr:hypothetical protein KUCAC02_000521 [Chaenocephalus aceratus]